jgi:acyl-coenzyme A thioesterase PaaI-like protein
MKRRAQEAEGELSILKGIETNRVKEAQDALANALEVNESHQKLNGKLQMRITELEQDNLKLRADNKKMHRHLDERVNAARKGGM